MIEAAHRKQNITWIRYLGNLYNSMNYIRHKEHTQTIHQGVWQVRTLEHVANESLRCITGQQVILLST